MKRIFAVVMVLAMALTFPPVSYADDSLLDKTGDWFATLGKTREEKDRILLERKMNRAAKKLEKGMEKAGKDLEKAFK